MTAYILKPAPEWADVEPSVFAASYHGDWKDPEMRRAFYALYESREDALDAAGRANLYPVTERYGVGSTVIYVAPPEMGGVQNALLTTRHHGARTSGLYVAAAAALIRAQRPVKPYTCVQCGTGFTASDARAKFCSNRCQQAAKYARTTGKTTNPNAGQEES